MPVNTHNCIQTIQFLGIFRVSRSLALIEWDLALVCKKCKYITYMACMWIYVFEVFACLFPLKSVSEKRKAQISRIGLSAMYVQTRSHKHTRNYSIRQPARHLLCDLFFKISRLLYISFAKKKWISLRWRFLLQKRPSNLETLRKTKASTVRSLLQKIRIIFISFAKEIWISLRCKCLWNVHLFCKRNPAI